jgi:hypothetical protein
MVASYPRDTRSTTVALVRTTHASVPMRAARIVMEAPNASTMLEASLGTDAQLDSTEPVQLRMRERVRGGETFRAISLEVKVVGMDRIEPSTNGL